MTARKTVIFGIALISIVFSINTVYAKQDYHGVPGEGSAQKGATAVVICSACHGLDGNSPSSAYPNLASQKYNYILKQLEDFRDGHRQSSVMTGMAMTIPQSSGHQNLKNIAAYFSSQKLKRAEGANAHPVAATPAELKMGFEVYRYGSSKEKVPACSACHGLGGEGDDPMAIPSLTGQHASYVVQQLDQFASGVRDNSPGQVMGKIAHALSTKQKVAVAAYMERLNPAAVLGIGVKTYSEYVKEMGSNSLPGIPKSMPSSTSSKPQAGHAKLSSSKNSMKTNSGKTKPKK